MTETRFLKNIFARERMRTARRPNGTRRVYRRWKPRSGARSLPGFIASCEASALQRGPPPATEASRPPRSGSWRLPGAQLSGAHGAHIIRLMACRGPQPAVSLEISGGTAVRGPGCAYYSINGVPRSLACGVPIRLATSPPRPGVRSISTCGRSHIQHASQSRPTVNRGSSLNDVPLGRPR